MNAFKPDVIYLILILVVPGLISQSVFNAMVAKGKNRQTDLYASILHSVVVYVFIYSVAVLILGSDIINTRTITSLITGYSFAPLITLMVMAATSIAWGILYSKFYRSKWLKKFLGRFAEAVEPPNIYAALLAEKYRDEINSDMRFWLTYKNGDEGYVEGCVEMAAVEESPREVYLTKVAYLDKARKEIRRLPEGSGIILKVDDLDLIEITIIKGIVDEE